jgi:hypothetical protein
VSLDAAVVARRELVAPAEPRPAGILAAAKEQVAQRERLTGHGFVAAGSGFLAALPEVRVSQATVAATATATAAATGLVVAIECAFLDALEHPEHWAPAAGAQVF